MANHEKPFDRLSKRFAVAVSRRSILHSLSAAVASTFLPWTKAFGQEPPKRAIGPYPKTLTGFMESPDYETVALEKRVIKPGSSLLDPSKLKESSPFCSYLVQITTVPGLTGGPAPFIQHFMCSAKDGICPTMMECQRGLQKSTEMGEWAKAFVVETSKKPDALKNKFNDRCQRGGSLAPDKTASFAFLNSRNEAIEELCIAVYSCENLGRGTAFCPIQSEAIVAGGKETVKKVCPQLNTCINEEIPRVQGYTQAELDAMPDDKRKETLRMLAEPAVPYKKST